jgi:hypothetical protein
MKTRLPLAEPLAHKSEKRMTFMDVSGKSKNYRYSKSSGLRKIGNKLTI